MIPKAWHTGSSTGKICFEDNEDLKTPCHEKAQGAPGDFWKGLPETTASEGPKHAIGGKTE